MMRIAALKNFRRASWRSGALKKPRCLSPPTGGRVRVFSAASHCCAGNFSQRHVFFLHFLLRQKKVDTFKGRSYELGTSPDKGGNLQLIAPQEGCSAVCHDENIKKSGSPFGATASLKANY